MEARAILRYAKVSPIKARQVLRVIQGMKAGDALYQLYPATDTDTTRTLTQEPKGSWT
jgi:ribosomal protein L22